MLVERSWAEWCTYGPQVMSVPDAPQGIEFNAIDATPEGIFATAHIEMKWVMFQLVGTDWAKMGADYTEYMQIPPWNSEEEIEYSIPR